jgi:ATP-dependent helicase/nuclease subunit A
LRSLAQALLRLHVPFVAVDDAALVEAPEAQDLVAVLDVLVSPQHRLSLARALRSPLFDVSDADLLALAGRAAPSGDWWAALLAWNDASDAIERARRWLPSWQQDARRLPPHDLLDRIVAQGELRERLASRVPAARRAIALATVDAVLAQALALDAGRYATPYGFVRALRKRTINVPAPDLGGAVRLLTMHGAKGLEADVVFVMDADPERTQTETATLLVDWPVGESAPRRCALIYSEKQVPPDLADLVADEQRARDREELNGLYVAMTRARRTLIFSATEPLRPGERESWWQRVAPHALSSTSPAATSVQPQPEPEPSIVELPRWRGAPIEPIAAAAFDDTAAMRLGQAVHRALEWYSGAGGDLSTLAAGSGAEFGAPADEVARLAGRIVNSPHCAAFFDRTALLWAGNEVPVALDGDILRIDRLVCLGPTDAPCWWVLDYKLQAQAASDAQVREQLERYCRAVAPLAAGAPVRAAVITGAGELQVVI